jgi:cytochrome P450 family 130
VTGPPGDARYVFRGGERWRDPWPAYRRLRDEAPVHRHVDDRFGEFWVLSRFADVCDAARDTATFSSSRGLTPDPDSMTMFEGRAAPIVMMDPPEHTSMRRRVSRPMTPRAVATLEPALRAFVDERLGRIAGQGRCDIVEALFKPLPSFVVAHFLGVPQGDRERFDGWTAAIVAAAASGGIAGAPGAALELFDYATGLIGRRRADPGDDLVSGLVAAGGDAVSAEWIVGFVFTMVTGGNDTTTGLLGGTAELLCAEPDQRQVLVDDPSLVRPAVDEFLRLTTPVQNLARTTTRAVDLHGTGIPAGAKVLLLYGAANRDEREFGPSAEQLDVRRVVRRSLGFGHGAHQCLGAAAAKLQAGIAIERLLARFPRFTVDADAGVFAPGPYVRRFASLPFCTGD